MSDKYIITNIIFNNISPLPCSHPACSKFCVHLEFLPEIGYKVKKVRSTFHTFHDYLNFCEEKKITGYLPFTLFRRLRATEADTQSYQIRVAEPCGIKCHSDVQSHILQ